MDNEIEIRYELYLKLEKEYIDFVEALKAEHVEVVLEKAYEKVIKEETYGMFFPEFMKFDIDQITALNKTERPLQKLYNGWMECDVNLNELYEENVYDTLADLVLQQKEDNY